MFARFVDIEPEEFQRVTEVTYLGYVNGTRAALRRMLPRDRGTIVQVGSTLAYRGIPLQSAYCGAKHAIQGFHESLRTELLHEGSNVRVTMVQMPAVNTPQFSWVLSRLPRPGAAGAADLPARGRRARRRVRRRPSRRREYWVGETHRRDAAGQRRRPGLLDRYLARTGFDAQQTDQPQAPDQPANLWEPADGADGRDFGAHGRSTTSTPVPAGWGLAAPRDRRRARRSRCSRRRWPSAAWTALRRKSSSLVPRLRWSTC